jgi:hypothetical protein
MVYGEQPKVHGSSICSLAAWTRPTRDLDALCLRAPYLLPARSSACPSPGRARPDRPPGAGAMTLEAPKTAGVIDRALALRIRQRRIMQGLTQQQIATTQSNVTTRRAALSRAAGLATATAAAITAPGAALAAELPETSSYSRYGRITPSHASTGTRRAASARCAPSARWSGLRAWRRTSHLRPCGSARRGPPDPRRTTAIATERLRPPFFPLPPRLGLVALRSEEPGCATTFR